MKNEMGGACGTYGRQDRSMQDLVGRPKGKRPYGIPRCKWKDHITTKMDIQKWDGEAWTGLIWLRIGTGGGLL
jgi:hypothetical protein